MEKWILHSNLIKNDCLDYTYFYMKWGNSKYPEISASWYTTLPIGCTFQKEVYWREFKKKIIICGEMSFNNTIRLAEIDKPERTVRNTSLLKSLLQKAIRRKNTRSALLSAYELMNRDIVQFLRRMPIIMLEDAFIHPSINNVIWFMAASPHIILDSNHKSYILGIIHDMSVLGYRHPIIKKEESTSITEYISASTLTSDYFRNIVLSLYLRKSFGGMKGDMKMINGFIDEILPSIYDNHTFHKIKHIQIHDTLKSSDILREAADFHCFPKILDDIHKHHMEYTVDEIKNSIWIHSSSISYKYIVGDNVIDDTNCKGQIWKTIQSTYDTYAKKYIYKSFYR